MTKKFFPYSGLLSGIFGVEARDPVAQGALNVQLEYATLTGNARQVQQLLVNGAEPSQELMLATVMQKHSRLTELFLSFDVEPTAEMTRSSIRSGDVDTFKLLIEHRAPVSDEDRVWGGIHGTDKIKAELTALADLKRPFHGGSAPRKNDQTRPS